MTSGSSITCPVLVGANPFAQVTDRWASSQYFGSRGSHWIYVGEVGDSSTSVGYDYSPAPSELQIVNNVFTAAPPAMTSNLAPRHGTATSSTTPSTATTSPTWSAGQPKPATPATPSALRQQPRSASCDLKQHRHEQHLRRPQRPRRRRRQQRRRNGQPRPEQPLRQPRQRQRLADLTTGLHVLVRNNRQTPSSRTR